LVEANRLTLELFDFLTKAVPKTPEQSGGCVDQCDYDFVQCWLACDGDQQCTRKCASLEEDCLNKCPCHLLCPNGCPCEEYECQRCEDLHGDEMQKCNDDCVRHTVTCLYTCPLFDSECAHKCVAENYESCIRDCPCAPEGTPAPEQTTALPDPDQTTIVEMTTEGVLDKNVQDIMYNTTANELELLNFTRYLKAHQTENDLRARKFPPEGTKEIFIGCGPTADIESKISLGAVMTPDQIFHLGQYGVKVPRNATATRNFFTYWDELSPRFTWGFSGEQEIYLNYFDCIDCKYKNCTQLDLYDNHRLSAFDDDFHEHGLVRCGQYIDSLDGGVMEDFTLVMYYR